MRVRALGALVGLVGLSTALMGAAPAGAGPSGSDKKFCKAVVSTNILFGAIEEEPTPKQEKKIGKLLTRVEQNASADVSADAETLVTAVQENPDSLFEDPEVQAAKANVDQWVAENCGYEVVPVTGTEYEFSGIPDELDAGIVLFEFTNQGAEIHELVVVQIQTDATLEELFELPEEEAFEQITFGAFTTAAQGETSYGYAKLDPGTWTAACFFPVGSTDFEALETVEGPPHFHEGMITEFEVTK
jgi:hypothetical protein